MKYFMTLIFLCILRLALTALKESANGVNKLDCETEKRLDAAGYEAIKALHKSMDDDLSGTIDLSESIEFVREELKMTEKAGMDTRQKSLHQNNDDVITVDDLWCRWVNTEERRWTTDQMVEWLENGVELPQYKSAFTSNNVRGLMLPRISVQNTSYLSSLGIINVVHRSKIQLKAMDAVLFGYRREKSSYWKDVILVTLLCLAVGLYWFAVLQRSSAQREMTRLSSQMDKLKDMESEFQDLQEKFHEERRKKESIEKKADLQEMEKTEEVEMLKSQLINAGRFWEKRPMLQNLLRRTYELEMNRINQQKSANLREMAEARDLVEKFRKKQSSLFNQIRTVHGAEMEGIDERILVLKTKLEETAQAMDECQHRWSQIEALSGFSLTNSPTTHVHASVSMPGAANKKSLNGLAGRVSPPLSFTHLPNASFAGFVQPAVTSPNDFDEYGMESGHIKDSRNKEKFTKTSSLVGQFERPRRMILDNGKHIGKPFPLHDTRERSPVLFEVSDSLMSSQRSVSANDLFGANGHLPHLHDSSSRLSRHHQHPPVLNRTETQTSFGSDAVSQARSTISAASTAVATDCCVGTTSTMAKSKKKFNIFSGSKKSLSSFKLKSSGDEKS